MRPFTEISDALREELRPGVAAEREGHAECDADQLLDSPRHTLSRLAFKKVNEIIFSSIIPHNNDIIVCWLYYPGCLPQAHPIALGVVWATLPRVDWRRVCVSDACIRRHAQYYTFQCGPVVIVLHELHRSCNTGVSVESVYKRNDARY